MIRQSTRIDRPSATRVSTFLAAVETAGLSLPPDLARAAKVEQQLETWLRQAQTELAAIDTGAALGATVEQLVAAA
jgi:hypothetical protein